LVWRRCKFKAGSKSKIPGRTLQVLRALLRLSGNDDDGEDEDEDDDDDEHENEGGNGLFEG
jgi:hypothetical protein